MQFSRAGQVKYYKPTSSELYSSIPVMMIKVPKFGFEYNLKESYYVAVCFFSSILRPCALPNVYPSLQMGI